MPSIVINGETVYLRKTSMRDFQRFAEITFQRLRPEASIRQSVGSVLMDALVQGQTLEDNVVQTVLWAMFDLGVTRLEYNVETKSMNLTEVKDTEASRGGEGAMAVAACETGRAYVAALANVQQRTVFINGQPVQYTVRWGDTLETIAFDWKVDPQFLLETNPQVDFTTLQPGQFLLLPALAGQD